MTSTAIYMPEDAPAWLRANCAYLTKVALGPEYVDLVGTVVRLEEHYGWEDGRKGLEKNGRPQILMKWIGNGREWGGKTKDFALEENEVEDFVKTWWAWWEDLQPSWRIDESGKLAREAAVGEGD